MSPNPGFLDFPARLPGGVQPRIVLFGAPHGSTYPGADSSGFAGAAATIRAASQDDAQFLDSWDFDLGGPLFEGREPCCVDAGDLPTSVLDNAGNRKLIEEKTRAIPAAGAAPLMIGGDDSVPIPFIAGFADHGPIWILQIDAHIDWRDERHGEPLGYSSTMRRASEMPHVAGIVRGVTRAIDTASDAPEARERLTVDLWTRVSETDRIDADLADTTLPIETLILRLCRDLGIQPHWPAVAAAAPAVSPTAPPRPAPPRNRSPRRGWMREADPALLREEDDTS